MPKLNFYETDAVKAFVLNILVENEELLQAPDDFHLGRSQSPERARRRRRSEGR